MTTIAYRDGILVADTAVYGDGTHCGQVIKIVKDKSGALAGCSGIIGDMSIFNDWFLSGRDGKYPTFMHHNSEGFIIETNGRILFCGGGGIFTPIATPFYTIGTGQNIVVGAMAMGASAREAVKIAAKYDLNTDEPLTVLTLGKKR